MTVTRERLLAWLNHACRRNQAFIDSRPQSKRSAVIAFEQRRGGVAIARLTVPRTASAARASPTVSFASGGRLIQASSASQSWAGIVTMLRLSTSISAASTDLRLMNSLSVVRDCSAAASRSARSSGVTRTLRMAVLCLGPPICNTIAYKLGHSNFFSSPWVEFDGSNASARYRRKELEPVVLGRSILAQQCAIRVIASEARRSSVSAAASRSVGQCAYRKRAGGGGSGSPRPTWIGQR